MKHQHARTLQALFAHPLRHGLPMRDVEALLPDLGGRVERLSGHRLQLQLADGSRLVLHAAPGPRQACLDEDGVLRLRRFLQEAGIEPAQAEADGPAPLPQPRGEQAHRLVIHLDHRGARLWWLDGEPSDHTDLHPEGVWGSGQRLSHRHDRDLAGQRAPLDHAYLQAISEAIAAADRVLLLGHGHGQSDLRLLLENHLRRHQPELLERIEAIPLDDTACSDAELLALARRFYGNQPHRQPLTIPGQERREAGSDAAGPEAPRS